MFVLFFFFKQKTAYEMRISDWSSDVCSSDLCDGARPLQRLQGGNCGNELHAVVGGRGVAARQFPLGRTGPEDSTPTAGPRIAAAGAVREDVDWAHAATHLSIAPIGRRTDEIGRAHV